MIFMDRFIDNLMQKLLNSSINLYDWQIEFLHTQIPYPFTSLSDAVRYYVDHTPESAVLTSCIAGLSSKVVSIVVFQNQFDKINLMAKTNKITRSHLLRSILYQFHHGPIPKDVRCGGSVSNHSKYDITDESLNSIKQLKNIQHPEMGYHKNLRYSGKDYRITANLKCGGEYE